MLDLIETLEFIGQSWDFSATICLLWVLWALFVPWRILKHPRSGQERLLNSIKNASPGQFYLDQLDRYLDFTARSWFKDAETIHDHRSLSHQQYTGKFFFGVDALLTEPAFVFSLKLALFYPILSVLLFWVFSGTDGKPSDA